VCDLNAEYSVIKDSIVIMATGIRARRSGFRNPVGENRFFSSSKPPARLGGPPSFLFNGYRVFFPVIKPPGLDVGNPPPYSAEVILNEATLRSVHAHFSF
jgi:hypothetical protein